MALLEATSALCILSILSVLSILSTTILLMILSIWLSEHHGPSSALAVAATCLQCTSLLVFLILIWLRSSISCRPTSIAHYRGMERRHLDIVLSFVISSLAALTTLATIVWLRLVLDFRTDFVYGSPSLRFFTSIAVLFAVSVLLQLTIFFIIISRHQPSMSTSHNGSLVQQTLHSHGSGSSRTRTLSLPPLEPMKSLTMELNEESLSPVSTTLSSLRTSFSASRTGSTKAKSTVQRLTAKTSESSFDRWDTSDVPSNLRDAVHAQSHQMSPQLPTIPGSRSASPSSTKALDGPCLPPSPHPPQSQLSPTAAEEHLSPGYGPVQMHCPPSSESLRPPHPSFLSTPPVGRSRAVSLESQQSQPALSFLPTQLHRNRSATSLAESVSHLRSCQNARSVGTEENIHPLFRSSSPVPPPGASLGTVVHAATVPEAEEVAATGSGPLRRRTESSLGMSSPVRMGEFRPFGIDDDEIASQTAVSPIGTPMAQRSRKGSMVSEIDTFVTVTPADDVAPVPTLLATAAKTNEEQEQEQEQEQERERERERGQELDQGQEHKTEAEAGTDDKPAEQVPEDVGSNNNNKWRKAASAIPGFVLSAGKRTSLLGFETRRKSKPLGIGKGGDS